MVVTAVITEETNCLRLKAEKPILDLPHADTTTGRVVPIKHAEGSQVDFGAEIYGKARFPWQKEVAQTFETLPPS